MIKQRTLKQSIKVTGEGYIAVKSNVNVASGYAKYWCDLLPVLILIRR